MKILKAEVDYDYAEFCRPRDRFANSPGLRLTIDALPPGEGFRFERRGDVFYAESEDVVRFACKADPSKPDDGFGGARTTLRMADGDAVSFVGGGSGCSENAHKFGFDPLMHCTFWLPPGRDAWSRYRQPPGYLGRGLTLSRAREVVEQFLPEWEIYACLDYVARFEIKRKDRGPKRDLDRHWTLDLDRVERGIRLASEAAPLEHTTFRFEKLFHPSEVERLKGTRVVERKNGWRGVVIGGEEGLRSFFPGEYFVRVLFNTSRGHQSVLGYNRERFAAELDVVRKGAA